MRPSSSTSDPATGTLLRGVLGRGAVAGQVGDHAWLCALLDVEAALAVASARRGLVPKAAAEAIALVCADTSAFDVALLGRAAAESGNPVVPLVQVIKGLVATDVAEHVHRGATSQDILDTAMMLVAKRAAVPLVADVRAGADRAAALASEHRDTIVAGRTLLQQAVPTTFGLKCAGWGSALDGAADRLAAVTATLPVQLGGAVGTLAGFDTDAPAALVEELADELGLVAPSLPWHTARLPVADLAGALGTAAGVVGKVALDVVLMAQTEVAEVREGVDGRGGSSTMAHKHNPVAAISARAAAARTPGLVATLFGAMPQEHERAAGAWHSEWEPMSDLLRSTGSAAAWLRDCLSNLVVDGDRMRANLDASGLESMREPEHQLGAALALVDRYLSARSERGRRQTAAPTRTED